MKFTFVFHVKICYHPLVALNDRVEGRFMKEREISLFDLFIELLLRWRGILLVMLAGGVLMGVFSYANSVRLAGTWQGENAAIEQAREEQQEKIDTWKQEAEEDIEAWLEENLTEKQRGNVDTLLFYEETYAVKQAYIDGSVYMNMDPNNVIRGDLIFLVDAGDPEETNRVTQIYEDLVADGELFTRLGKVLNMPEASVRELVALERTAYGQQVPVNTVRLSVIYENEEGCRKILQEIEAYFAEQQAFLEGEIGSHSVKMLKQSVSAIVDTDMLNAQINLANEQANRKATIDGIKEGFSDEERFYYIYLTGGDYTELLTVEKEEEDEDTGEPEKVTTAQTAPVVGVSVKYVILGVTLAAFIYIFIIFLKYILSGRLRYTDDVQDLYDIPVLGRIPAERRKKPFDFVDNWIISLRDRNRRSFSQEEAVRMSAVGMKMAALKKETGTVCCMGCGMQNKSLDICGQIKEQLATSGLEITVLNNVLYDAEAMEQLGGMEGAVLVETADVTLYDEILKELELLRRQEIEVLGCVVVE